MRGDAPQDSERSRFETAELTCMKAIMDHGQLMIVHGTSAYQEQEEDVVTSIILGLLIFLDIRL